MSKPVLITLGIIVALLGLLFTLQGLGVVGGSAMSGSTLWAVLGPVIAIVGIVLVVLGLRRGRKPCGGGRPGWTAAGGRPRRAR